ncbi:MAG: haloalkane dehalogenase [Wenzhouxiangellaceae bacterium]
MSRQEVLRTPEHYFDNLIDYPYPPRYAKVAGLRLHYLDEGAQQGPIVLMLHGEPTWSFLYRRMIPHFVASGRRVLAPDLIGFGKSDKPASIEDYSYQRHVDWLLEWLRDLDLRDITLVCQDWGSLLGLRLLATEPDRFAQVVVANGALPTGDESMPGIFKLWQAFARYSPWFPADRIVQAGCKGPLGKAIRRAYRAPFPDRRYLAGARAFPRLVPTTPDNPASQANRDAWRLLEQWQRPFLTLFGNADPIMRPMAKVFQQRVPGAQGQPHRLLRPAGHFIQEDQGVELAIAIIDWLQPLTAVPNHGGDH